MPLTETNAGRGTEIGAPGLPGSSPVVLRVTRLARLHLSGLRLSVCRGGLLQRVGGFLCGLGIGLQCLRLHRGRFLSTPSRLLAGLGGRQLRLTRIRLARIGSILPGVGLAGVGMALI